MGLYILVPCSPGSVVEVTLLLLISGVAGYRPTTSPITEDRATPSGSVPRRSNHEGA